jgi:Domain of unknown function (DUF4350)
MNQRSAIIELPRAPTRPQPLPGREGGSRAVASHALRLGALVACLALAGCEKELVTEYGRYSGSVGRQSVNGLGVLGSMFEHAGHTVSVARWLSPSVGEKADVIVWAPDDAAPPSQAVRDWFERWMWQDQGKTLIYIGRDYDAEATYWQAILPGAPEDERAEIERRLRRARVEQSFRRRVASDKTDCQWFTAQTGLPHRDLRTLEGDESWLADVDPSKTEIERDTRLIPAAFAEVLLASGDDVLVSRQEIGYGQLIVVSNGSFLLNLPLVNHEHRKLAGKLIDLVEPNSRVVFLETEGAPTIHDKDPEVHTRGGLDILGVEPLNRVFLHLSVLGVIFCFARLPIFGRPGPLPVPPASDFGQHVEAVGELLAKTGDSSYAAARLLHYQQSGRHEASGGQSTGTSSRG